MICCLAFAILKIILIGGEEVVARYQPLDDFCQIMAASRGYWFSSGYDWTMYVHLPVYSFWVGFVHVTGVPLRIATELLFLGSSFLFVVSLSRSGVSVFAAVISYALIIFHPASFQIFNYTLPGTLYSSMFLVTLSSILSSRLIKAATAASLFARAISRTGCIRGSKCRYTTVPMGRRAAPAGRFTIALPRVKT